MGLDGMAEWCQMLNGAFLVPGLSQANCPDAVQAAGLLGFERARLHDPTLSPLNENNNEDRRLTAVRPGRAAPAAAFFPPHGTLRCPTSHW